MIKLALHQRTNEMYRDEAIPKEAFQDFSNYLIQLHYKRKKLNLSGENWSMLTAN